MPARCSSTASADAHADRRAHGQRRHLRPRRRHPDGGGAVGRRRHDRAGRRHADHQQRGQHDARLAITGTGGLVKQGSGILTLTGTNTYSGGTTITGGLINFAALNNFGTGTITLNGGGLQWAAGTTTDISSRLVLGAAGATFDTGGNNVTFGYGPDGRRRHHQAGRAASSTWPAPTPTPARPRSTAARWR